MRSLLLPSLLYLLAAPAFAGEVPPSCTAAYEQLRAGQLSEATDSMAQCARATPVDVRQTVMLYERVQLLDRLGRHEEALTQLIALTEPAHFETGLDDSLSGPGAWSRDAAQVQARRATGIQRADLLLDIGWRKLRKRDFAAAIDWAERSARHALTRYRPDGDLLPNDRAAGCALALRGFARAESGASSQAIWADLSRGHIRGCEKLPVAAEIARLSADNRKLIETLKQRFEALQTAVSTTSTQLRNQTQATARPATGDLGALGQGMLAGITARQKAVEPLLAQRQEFLAAETSALGNEPLSAIEVKP